MLALTLLAALPAIAAFEGEARAPLLDVVGAFPADGAEVPANGRVVLYGGSPGDLQIVRVRGDGSEAPLARTAVPVDQLTTAFIVEVADVAAAGDDDGAPLAPGASFVLAARCSSGCSFSGLWTIGLDDANAPAFDDGPARVDVRPLVDEPPFGATRDYLVTLTLPGARDDRSGVVLAVASEEGDTISQQTFLAGQPLVRTLTLLGGHARTVCFDAVAVDAAGNEAPFREQLCADLAPAVGGGCASTSMSPANALGAAALLALLGRRRRHTLRSARGAA